MPGAGGMHGQGQGHGAMMMAQGNHMMHGAMDGSGMAGVNPGTMESVKAGDLELTGGYTRAMLPGQPVGGGFITIKNAGAQDDILVAADRRHPVASNRMRWPWSATS